MAGQAARVNALTAAMMERVETLRRRTALYCGYLSEGVNGELAQQNLSNLIAASGVSEDLEGRPETVISKTSAWMLTRRGQR